MLNELDKSQLSYIEFKTMVIRKLSELSVNHQKLQGNYKEFAAHYISMKGTINNQQGSRGKKYNF